MIRCRQFELAASQPQNLPRAHRLFMYRFNYEYLPAEGKPVFACIVPAKWRQKNLPTMGGEIVYVGQQDRMNACTDYVFEFFDETLTESLPRTICLDIHHRKTISDNAPLASYSKLFATPARVQCATFNDSDESNDWCFEVVLLNHFFGSHALSALMGNIYLDFHDVLAVMSLSHEFTFEFGIGKTPQDILPGIIERLGVNDAKSAFAMLFCKSGTARLAHLDEIVGAISRLGDDVASAISDAAVDDDRMLISILIGR